MEVALLDAISQKRLVGFMYGGFYRVVEPYLLGVYKNKMQLLCFQVGGESGSGRLPEWRRMNLAEISELRILPEVFVGVRPTKGLGKSHFDRVLSPPAMLAARLPRVIYLVSGVDRKRPQVTQAKELYHSIWFKAARMYAEQHHAQWFILSTKHGLLSPEAQVAPYDLELKSMTPTERSEWAERVFGALQPKLYPGDRVVLLAGAPMRELLLEKLESTGCDLEMPLQNLRIGEQVHWLQQHTQPPKTPQSPLPLPKVA